MDGRTLSESRASAVRFFVKVGKWVVAGIVVAISGLAATFSPDPNIASAGWFAVYGGTLSAMLILSLLVLFAALWSQKQTGSPAGFFAFGSVSVMSLTIAVAFFLNLPEVRDALFLTAILIGLPAPVVQAWRQRRQRRQVAFK